MSASPTPTDTTSTTSLLQNLGEDLLYPDFYWQIPFVLVCLGIAWILARHLRRRLAATQDRLGLWQALLEQTFPIFSVLLLAITKSLLPLVQLDKMPLYLFDLFIPLLLSLTVVRALRHMLQRSFPRASWIASIGRVFSILVWGWLALFLSGVAPEVIRTLETVGFRIGAQQINLWMIVNGVVVIALTLLASLWASSLVEARLKGAQEIDVSLRIVLGRMCKALFVLFAVLMSFSLIGLDITALSVFTGALGVGLGMGLQKIASNYVSGFIILLDRSIRLGNIIQVSGDVSGTVTQITTRYTVLKNMVGMEFIVPNESLVANIVQNQTFSDSRTRAQTSVSVAYSSDLEKVLPLLEAIARAHPRVIADPAPLATIARFADSGIDLDLGFWISDPQNGTSLLRSQINLEIWRRFRAEGIEIPFPQREVRLLESTAQ
ncbi:mechanosensitive ion channel protein [Betaproteobacteria bacterium]|nr:mechanosensitive ion channel protein [Betaproteobacteria bacterium]GHU40434.1 mechanosensitive ion channel protein [Betaproteobacteria bacterium]